MSTHGAVVDADFVSGDCKDITAVDGETSDGETPFPEFKRGGNGVRDGDGESLGGDFLERGNGREGLERETAVEAGGAGGFAERR